MNIILGAISGIAFILLVHWLAGKIAGPMPMPANTKPHRPDLDVEYVNRGMCPNCHKEETLCCGPQGGMSINVACQNCMEEFNIHSGFGTGAFKVDRTGRLTVARARVFGIVITEAEIKGECCDKPDLIDRVDVTYCSNCGAASQN